MQRLIRRGIQWFRDQRGQAALETALVSFVLLLLFAGAIDIGRAFYHYVAITNAAREGARTAARLPCYPEVSGSAATVRSAATAAALAEATNTGTLITAADVTIRYTPSTAVCPAAGTAIKVTVTFDYETLLDRVLGNTGFVLSNAATMIAFGGDQQ